MIYSRDYHNECKTFCNNIAAFYAKYLRKIMLNMQMQNYTKYLSKKNA